MKTGKKRTNVAPHWVKEEVPQTAGALKLYERYCDDEIKHCKSVLNKLKKLHAEASRRIEEYRKQELADIERSDGLF